eukprot:GDKJ01008894.1.p1 GENE.GDKJ01008894.1~~GDKJ01008894.1.p1  ORF type:complete len:138 (+),score=34.03 GDKJ01008894.1:91-504(+)
MPSYRHQEHFASPSLSQVNLHPVQMGASNPFNPNNPSLIASEIGHQSLMMGNHQPSYQMKHPMPLQPSNLVNQANNFASLNPYSLSASSSYNRVPFSQPPPHQPFHSFTFGRPPRSVAASVQIVDSGNVFKDDPFQR